MGWRNDFGRTFPDLMMGPYFLGTLIVGVGRLELEPVRSRVQNGTRLNGSNLGWYYSKVDGENNPERENEELTGLIL